MYLSADLNHFSGKLTDRQKQLVNNFLAAKINWDEVKHGDKRKLDENISVVFLAAEGTEQWKNVLEAHRKFYDLHYTAEGNDVIVSKPVPDCNNIRTEYNDEGDYILYDEAPQESFEVPAGNFCLIPPADAHMALYGNCGFVRKLVFKIPIR